MKGVHEVVLLIVLLCIGTSSGVESQYADYHDPHCGGKQVIVHLFEWKWTDVAAECERYLGPKGFCGVQVSPPQEHCVINQNNDQPWWQRYQPVSYILNSRSGTEAQFRDMVTRCNNVGVRIYPDIVLNHMAGADRAGTGYAGSPFNAGRRYFPAVPFSVDDFHTRAECPSKTGDVDNYNDPVNVRNCNLVGLVDIDGFKPHVRTTQAAYLNKLIDIGVAGFRSDASKHIWPADLKAIQNMTKDLPEGGRPMFFHEVVDYGDGAVHDDEYFSTGWVSEFRYGKAMYQYIDDLDNLQYVYNKSGMNPTDQALVFLDNQDTQRKPKFLNYKDPARYARAQAFTLAYDYGLPRVMSSYTFYNHDNGPPHNPDMTVKDVTINQDGSCGNGWICEHRWRPIGNMARFRTAVTGQPVSNWNADRNVLTFNRGDRGFFAMSNTTFSVTRHTGMAPGVYCDLISNCQVKVTVNGAGYAHIIPGVDPIVAIIAKDEPLHPAQFKV